MKQSIVRIAARALAVVELLMGVAVGWGAVAAVARRLVVLRARWVSLRGRGRMAMAVATARSVVVPRHLNPHCCMGTVGDRIYVLASRATLDCARRACPDGAVVGTEADACRE